MCSVDGVKLTSSSVYYVTRPFCNRKWTSNKLLHLKIVFFVLLFQGAVAVCPPLKWCIAAVTVQTIHFHDSLVGCLNFIYGIARDDI